MKIVLQQHHWQAGIQYEPGDTIEVSQQEYDFIMGEYKRQRLDLVQEGSEVGMPTDTQLKEAEAIGKKA